MAPRDTTTGAVLEALVLPALARGGYTAARQVHLGTRLGGRGRHLVDVLATDPAGRRLLVSLKWSLPTYPACPGRTTGRSRSKHFATGRNPKRDSCHRAVHARVTEVMAERAPGLRHALQECKAAASVQVGHSWRPATRYSIQRGGTGGTAQIRARVCHTPRGAWTRSVAGEDRHRQIPAGLPHGDSASAAWSSVVGALRQRGRDVAPRRANLGKPARRKPARPTIM